MEASGDRVTWTYDAVGRLTREQRAGTTAYDGAFTYDAVGNRLTALTGGTAYTYTYNAADQMTVTQAGATLTTYSYDGAGNTAGLQTGGSRATYTWDSENRLWIAITPSGARMTCTYDADGRRRRRVVGTTYTKFVWDGEKVLQETDSAGATQAQYTLAPAPAGSPSADDFGGLVSQRRAGVSSFYQFDALGSTDRLLDASGATTDSYLYRAFGGTTTTGSTENPYRFVGGLGYSHETMASLGLWYVRERWLQASGRWHSVDPVPTEPAYQYVRNMPTMAVDPSGRLCRALWGGEYVPDWIQDDPFDLSAGAPGHWGKPQLVHGLSIDFTTTQTDCWDNVVSCSAQVMGMLDVSWWTEGDARDCAVLQYWWTSRHSRSDRPDWNRAPSVHWDDEYGWPYPLPVAASVGSRGYAATSDHPASPALVWKRPCTAVRYEEADEWLTCVCSPDDYTARYSMKCWTWGWDFALTSRPCALSYAERGLRPMASGDIPAYAHLDCTRWSYTHL